MIIKRSYRLSFVLRCWLRKERWIFEKFDLCSRLKKWSFQKWLQPDCCIVLLLYLSKAYKRICESFVRDKRTSRAIFINDTQLVSLWRIFWVHSPSNRCRFIEWLVWYNSEKIDIFLYLIILNSLFLHFTLNLSHNRASSAAFIATTL